ncbi:MAG: hypothetical protein K8J09_13385 [Planctomycetes bacterium]|nr:hypothetical protein [Planctomycetota bacterium]
MGTRCVVVLCVFVGGVSAQTPPSTSSTTFDLPALIKRLEGDGEAPAVSLPGDLGKQVLALDAKLTEADRERLFEDAAWGVPDGSTIAKASWVVALAALVRARGGDEQASLAEVWREYQACRQMRLRAEVSQKLEVLTSPAPGRWEASYLEAAGKRGQWLGGRILRSWPDSREAGDVLVGLRDATSGQMQEVLRRFGEQVPVGLVLTFADRALRSGDLDTAAGWLDRLAAARPARSIAVRELGAVTARDLRARIAAAKALEGDTEVVRLRRLQATGGALARSRELVAGAGVDFALPYAILAGDAIANGDAATCSRMLDAALARAGNDYTTVAALLLQKVLRGVSSQGRDNLDKDLQDVRARCDELLANDRSQDAAALRALRRFGLVCGEAHTQLDDLAAVREFVAECPDQAAARRILFVAACSTQDVAAALQAVSEPLAPALAADPALVYERASVAVQLAIAAAAAPATVEPMLQELERVQGDAADAEYLRGVMAWASATSRDDTDPAAAAARTHFAKARRQVGERGGLCALQALLQTRADDAVLEDLFSRWRLLNDLSSEGEREDVVLPFACTRMLSLGTALPVGDRATVLERSATSLSDYLLDAAEAAFHARRGDLVQARRCARAALEQSDGNATARRCADRGVYPSRYFQFDLRFTDGRVVLATTFRCSLVVLPPLPDEKRLHELAGD